MIKLSKQIQDISQGNYYSERALNNAINSGFANPLELKALQGFLAGYHASDISNNIMRLQDLSIKLNNQGL